ncbi:MAG: chorismate mutase [Tenericutes bacterium]|jgi:chorismate mutase|nr:chorismate mutase [Mycoplasmatota bacterium]
MKKYRKKLNQIDDEIRRLFIERMKLIKQIAKYKIDNNILVEDKAREKEMIEHIDIEDPLIKDLYIRVLTEMISVSKIYQETIKEGAL